MSFRALFLAASISGILVGLLSATPIVYVLNFLLYAWVWLGALFAVYLYRHWALAVKPSQAAVVGLFAGLIAAPVTFIASYFVGKMTVGNSGCMLAAGSAFTFFYVLPFPVVGAIAGAIAGVLFERKRAPEA